MSEDVIGGVIVTAFLVIYVLAQLWAVKHRRDMEAIREAAERQRAEDEYWHDMLRQIGALPNESNEEAL